MARVNMTLLFVGWVVSGIGLSAFLAAPAGAQHPSRQQRVDAGRWPSGGVTAWPQNTPPGNVVCWNGCGHPGSIVMGADPDPFIRSQILRDASRFFGGGGR